MVDKIFAFVTGNLYLCNKQLTTIFFNMATIIPSISTSADKISNLYEIYIRFSGGRNKVFRAKTHLFTKSEWLSVGTNKFIKDSSKKKLLTQAERDEETKITEVREKLNQLCNYILEEFNDAVSKGIDIDKDWLVSTIDVFHNPNKARGKAKTLLAIIDAFIASAPERIQKNGTNKGKPITAQTQLHYKQTQKQVYNFLQETFAKQSPGKKGKNTSVDIALSDVNELFYDEFVKYQNSKGYSLNTIGKHIKNIKAFINWLPLEERISCQFVEPKKCAKLTEEVDNIYLTETELSAIANAKLSANYLDKVRDQFLLLAWTGCRYSDLCKLTKDNISDSDGYKVFKLEQKKTGAKVVIPIFPEVQRILDKYNYILPQAMPNQDFNRYIKKVCNIAGITEGTKIERTVGGNKSADIKPKYECVSAHTARRSFATNMYKRGFPTLMIMAITGHKTEKAFLTYIKVTKEENAAAMMRQFIEQQSKQHT
jgi:integrase